MRNNDCPGENIPNLDRKVHEMTRGRFGSLKVITRWSPGGHQVVLRWSPSSHHVVSWYCFGDDL